MMHILAYLYLALPLIIFLFGWVKLTYAVAMMLVLFCGLLIVWNKYHQIKHNACTYGELALISVLALFATYISGAGGFIFPNTDWIKHNSILLDLVSFGWPFGYTYPHIDGTVTLSYYLGWYMAPALIGKIGGLDAAYITQFVYTHIGLLFIFIFAVGFSNTKRRFAFLFLVLMGSIVMTVTPLQQFIRIINLAYFSHVGSLRLVPNQTIPVMLISCILMDDCIKNRNHAVSLMWFALGLFWSPLALVGVLPLVLIQLSKLRSMSRTNVVAVTYFLSVTIFMFLWYKPNVFNIQAKHLFMSVFVPSSMSEVFQVGLFLFVQTIVPVFLIYRYGRNLLPAIKHIFYAEAMFLSILPFLHYGVFNDLVTRGSIAGVFCISVVTALLFADIRLSVKMLFSPLVIVIGYFVVMHTAQLFFSMHGVTRTPHKHVTEFESSDVLTQQYIGYGNSFFVRRLMKPFAHIHSTIR